MSRTKLRATAGGKFERLSGHGLGLIPYRADQAFRRSALRACQHTPTEKLDRRCKIISPGAKRASNNRVFWISHILDAGQFLFVGDIDIQTIDRHKQSSDNGCESSLGCLRMGRLFHNGSMGCLVSGQKGGLSAIEICLANVGPVFQDNLKGPKPRRARATSEPGAPPAARPGGASHARK